MHTFFINTSKKELNEYDVLFDIHYEKKTLVSMKCPMSDWSDGDKGYMACVKQMSDMIDGYVELNNAFNLIIYIDKPEGISLDDCEMVNDAVEPILDEADPIEGSYYLEISSPGLERELKTPEHIMAFVGERVLVKLYAAKDGKKAFDGTIESFDEEKNELTLSAGNETAVLSLKDCASIKTVCEF